MRSGIRSAAAVMTGAAVAVADQDHILQIAKAQHTSKIGHVSFQSDLRAEQMRPVAEAGQGYGAHFMAGAPQSRCDVAPAPAAEPRPGHKYVGGHSGLRVFPYKFFAKRNYSSLGGAPWDC
jgi:hypothetical protein